jgi:hypothetical protein
MKLKDIEEGNVLIAKFMGESIPNPVRDGEFGLMDYKYHYSWNEIMPVIEKISSIKFDDFDYAYPRTFGMISQETGEFMFRFNRYPLFCDSVLLTAAFRAVIDFIQSYNTVK